MASIQSSNPNGASVGYTYDDLNQLSTVVDNRLSGNNTTTYAYDPANNLTTATYPNGVQSVMTYDALNRITGLAASSSAAEVSGYTYQRGPTGNLNSATELNGRAINWSYDGIYRLTNEAVTSDPNNVNGSVAYSLDPVGNRLSDASSLAGINSGSFSYNADDEVSTETYDNNGNTLITGGNQLISNTWTVSFFGYDGGGNVRNLTNATGATTDEYEYDAFGNSFTKEGATPNNYLYRDEQFDPDLGLYYLRARYYNPLTGRFLSRDPENGMAADPATLHKYMYANGDAANLADPTGRAAGGVNTAPGTAGGGAAGYAELTRTVMSIVEAAAPVIVAAEVCALLYEDTKTIALTSGSSPRYVQKCFVTLMMR